METELERMIVRFVGDQGDLLNAYKEVEASGERAAVQAEKAAARVEGLVGSMTNLARVTVGVLAGLGITSWLKDVFREFDNAEQEFRRLEVQIRYDGEAVEETMERSREFADELENLTIVGGGTTVAMLAQARSFGAVGRASEQAVRDAIALSAATTGSARSAENMIRVTAALARGDIERAMSMSRMIPQLRGMRNESEFLARAQTLIATGMESAALEAQTASGRIAQLGESIKTLKEMFGAEVADILKPIVTEAKKLVEWFQKIPKPIKQAIVLAGMMAAAVVTISAAVAAAAFIFNAGFGGVGIIVGFLVTAAVAAATWASKLESVQRAWVKIKVGAMATWRWIAENWKMLTVMIGGPIGLAVVLVVKHWARIKQAASDAWDWTVNKVSEFWTWFRPIWRTAVAFVVRSWETIVGAAGKALDWIVENWKMLTILIGGPVGALVVLMVTHWETIRDAAVTAWEWTKDAVIGFARWVRPIWRAAIGFISALWNTVVKVASAAWEFIKRAATVAWDTISKIITEWWTVVRGTFGEIATKAQELWRAVFGDARISWDGVRDVIIDTFIRAEHILGNFRQYSEYIWTGVRLDFMVLSNVVTHFFTGVLAPYLAWLPTAFQAAWGDVSHNTQAVFTNMGNNVTGFFRMVKDRLMGRSTEWRWTSLTQGIRATVVGLPRVFAREIGPAERALRAEFDRLGATLNESWERFRARRRAEIFAETPWLLDDDSVADAEAEARRDGFNVGNQFTRGVAEGMRQLEHVQVFSAEGLARIRAHMESVMPELRNRRMQPNVGGRQALPPAQPIPSVVGALSSIAADIGQRAAANARRVPPMQVPPPLPQLDPRALPVTDVRNVPNINNTFVPPQRNVPQVIVPPQQQVAPPQVPQVNLTPMIASVERGNGLLSVISTLIPAMMREAIDAIRETTPSVTASIDRGFGGVWASLMTLIDVSQSILNNMCPCVPAPVPIPVPAPAVPPQVNVQSPPGMPPVLEINAQPQLVLAPANGDNLAVVKSAIVDASMKVVEAVKGSTIAIVAGLALAIATVDGQPVAAEVKRVEQQVVMLDAPKVDVSVEAADIKLPRIDVPQVEVPLTDAADVELPKVNIPPVDVPQTEIPKVDITAEKVEVPPVNVPEIKPPQVEVPQARFDLAPVVVQLQQVNAQLGQLVVAVAAGMEQRVDVKAPQVNVPPANAPQINVPQVNAPQAPAPVVQIHVNLTSDALEKLSDRVAGSIDRSMIRVTAAVEQWLGDASLREPIDSVRRDLSAAIDEVKRSVQRWVEEASLRAAIESVRERLAAGVDLVAQRIATVFDNVSINDAVDRVSRSLSSWLDDAHIGNFLTRLSADLHRWLDGARITAVVTAAERWLDDARLGNRLDSIRDSITGWFEDARLGARLDRIASAVQRWFDDASLRASIDRLTNDASQLLTETRTKVGRVLDDAAQAVRNVGAEASRALDRSAAAVEGFFDDTAGSVDRSLSSVSASVDRFFGSASGSMDRLVQSLSANADSAGQAVVRNLDSVGAAASGGVTEVVRRIGDAVDRLADEMVSAIRSIVADITRIAAAVVMAVPVGMIERGQEALADAARAQVGAVRRVGDIPVDLLGRAGEVLGGMFGDARDAVGGMVGDAQPVLRPAVQQGAGFDFNNLAGFLQPPQAAVAVPPDVPPVPVVDLLTVVEALTSLREATVVGFADVVGVATSILDAVRGTDQEIEAPAVEVPAVVIPQVEVPPIPEVVVGVEVPELQVPDVEVPAQEAVNVEIPSIEVQNVDVPPQEAVEVPEMQAPELRVPDINIPDCCKETTAFLGSIAGSVEALRGMVEAGFAPAMSVETTIDVPAVNVPRVEPVELSVPSELMAQLANVSASVGGMDFPTVEVARFDDEDRIVTATIETQSAARISAPIVAALEKLGAEEMAVEPVEQRQPLVVVDRMNDTGKKSVRLLERISRNIEAIRKRPQADGSAAANL